MLDKFNSGRFIPHKTEENVFISTTSIFIELTEEDLPPIEEWLREKNNDKGKSSG